ncbi:hypothetical protein [Szabonella alba]|uniref:Uncharacterized protein n=1 Tax=Szabonella alba TaxID=2804194 RepID=A0A8K0VB64_9RHOB|nr:hypothetical protein [Szabonella alba]MBL4916993.1 hypothetical protein [Szabonella alba]
MSILTLLTDILFVGHSLVGPTLPAMVEAGLARQGMEMQVAAQIINGAPLKYNWENGAAAEGENARQALSEGRSRVLVLTEAIPLAAQIEWNDSAAHVARFAGLAWQMRPDTQVYVYETWHSLHSGPGADIRDDPGAGMAWRDRITADLPLWESLTTLANEARPDGAPPLRLIPAGQAMGRLADAIAAGQVPGIARIEELFDDEIHPSDRGLGFLALVHIAAISDRSPEGLPAKLTRHWPSREAVITDEQAAVFQRIAWETVRDYRAVEAERQVRATEAPPETATPDPAPLPDPAETDPSAADLPPPDLPDENTAETTILSPPPTAEPAAPSDRTEDGALPPILVPDGPRGITNPRLSLNLAPVVDWSVQQPFLDVMKTARPWIGHLPGRWGGMEYADLRAGGYLDAQGWPLHLPEGVTGIATLILTDLPPDAGGVAGRYVLRHQGRGELRIEGRARVLSRAPGRVEFRFAPGEGGVILTITETDPDDPIRAISVVRQEREAALDAGEVFNPDWLNLVRGARVLRFMDWMATNNATLAEAGDRPRRDDFTWALQGVPMSVMLALANGLQAEPWFTLPHRASDDLIRLWAGEVRDTLSPDLRAHVEFSNEVWNWQFEQARWAQAQARDRWQAEGDAWVQFYALRAAEMADLWTAVFGDQANSRLNRVISTQTGWLGLEAAILDAPLVRAEGRPAPVDSFDSYAVTGYFAASLGVDDKAPTLRGWLGESLRSAEAQADQQALTGRAREDFLATHRFDLALERAADELQDGSVTGDAQDTLDHLLTMTLRYHAGVAQARGLDLVMYEGGTHVTGIGAQLEDRMFSEFYHHLNYSPEMGALYSRLLEGWAGLTDAPFTAFNDVEHPTKWGSWGGLRHLGDDNPRWRAMAGGCPGC